MKVLLTVFFVTALSGLYVTVYWLPEFDQRSKDILDRFTRQHVHAVADSLAPLMRQNRLAAIAEALETQLNTNPDWVEAALYDNKGQQLLPARALVEPAGENNSRYVAPLTFGNEPLGILVVVEDPSQDLDYLKRKNFELFATLLVGLLFIAAAISFLVDKFVARPILALSAAAAKIGEGEFQAILPKAGKDEIGLLIDSFAAMRDNVACYQIEATRQHLLLQSVIDAVPALITLKDNEHRFILVNRTQADELGCTPEEAVGRRRDEFRTIRAGLDAEEDRRVTDLQHRRERQVMRSGRAILHEEDRLQRQDRDDEYRLTSKIPLSDEAGNVTGILTVATDISELKRTEKELRSARNDLERRVEERTKELLSASKAARDGEKRFQDFAESSADWFWEMDADLRFTYMSPNVENMVGAPAEWHYGKTRRDLLGDNYEPLVWEAHLADLRARRPFKDFTFRRKGDGKIKEKWLCTSGKPFFGENGAFLGYRGTGRDVTALIERELALQNSEKNLRTILEDSPLGVAIMRHTWQGDHVRAERLFANRALTRLFGTRSSQQLVELPVADTWVDLQQFHELNESMKTGVELNDFEVRRRRYDGSEIWISMNTRPVVYNGEACTMVWHFDVTKRKEAEKSTEQLVLAINAMSECVNLHDAEDRLVFCNDQYRALNRAAPGASELGATFEQQQMSILSAGLVPDAAGREQAWLRERLERYRNPKGPFEMRRQDGTWLLINDQRLPGGGTISSAIDITERKGVEAKLHQAQKMEAVGQLTGGIAHDFNNMLTATIGNLDLLSTRLSKDTVALRYIDTVRRASKRGAELIDRLLAFSRQQVLAPKQIVVNDIMPHFRQLLGQTLTEDIDFEARLSEDLWPVTVDPGQLENALLNLSINARDAMPGGGTLLIETRNQYLSPRDADRYGDIPPGEYVVIAIADNGCGMAAETLQHAFEPFFTTKGVGEGSGLGLSMVFGFAKQSGGFAHLESEIDGGTTARIFLPRAVDRDTRTTWEDDDQSDETSPPYGEETILLVEDDENVRAATAEFLIKCGYRVLDAGNGPAALGLINEDGNIDLLLTDIVLPGRMSGLEIAEKFAARKTAGKIIFCSGYPRDLLDRRAKIEVDTELLKKPYRFRDLARLVRETLDGRCI